MITKIIVIATMVMDILYLCIMPVIKYPLLTIFMIILLLADVLLLPIIFGKATIVLDGRNKFYLKKKGEEKHEKNDV